MSDREQLHTGFALESLGRELTTMVREGGLDLVRLGVCRVDYALIGKEVAIDSGSGGGR